MPSIMTKSISPKGHPYVKMLSTGEVTAADAEAGSKRWGPGGDVYGLPILAVVDSSAKFSPEARQMFTKNNEGASESQPVAVVVSSAPLRVMLSFIIRATGAAANTRFFSSEAEAMAFIDEKLG